jgi:DNA-binding CsgD family transcriptional regulator
MSWFEMATVIGGSPNPQYGDMAVLAAIAGDRDEAFAWLGRIVPLDERIAADRLDTEARACQALVVLGDWPAAVAAGRAARAAAARGGFMTLGAAPFRCDLVEALVQLGELDEAGEVAAELAALAAHSGLPRGAAEAARADGLVRAARGDTAGAVERLREAVEVHTSMGLPLDLARSHLALGSALRRAGRRSEAVTNLEAAAASFAELPSPPYLERTRAELQRVGGRRGSPTELTPTERQVVELVAAGLGNAEIASRLSISLRTVESNLTRVYRKMGVRGRTEMIAALLAPPSSTTG